MAGNYELEGSGLASMKSMSEEVVPFRRFGLGDALIRALTLAVETLSRLPFFVACFGLCIQK